MTYPTGHTFHRAEEPSTVRLYIIGGLYFVPGGAVSKRSSLRGVESEKER
jgi:hypothetical protein